MIHLTVSPDCPDGDGATWTLCSDAVTIGSFAPDTPLMWSLRPLDASTFVLATAMLFLALARLSNARNRGYNLVALQTLDSNVVAFNWAVEAFVGP
jgi:hypothetical protein